MRTKRAADSRRLKAASADKRNRKGFRVHVELKLTIELIQCVVKTREKEANRREKNDPVRPNLHILAQA